MRGLQDRLPGTGGRALPGPGPAARLRGLAARGPALRRADRRERLGAGRAAQAWRPAAAHPAAPAADARRLRRQRPARRRAVPRRRHAARPTRQGGLGRRRGALDHRILRAGAARLGLGGRRRRWRQPGRRPRHQREPARARARRRHGHRRPAAGPRAGAGRRAGAPGARPPPALLAVADRGPGPQPLPPPGGPEGPPRRRPEAVRVPGRSRRHRRRRRRAHTRRSSGGRAGRFPPGPGRRLRRPLPPRVLRHRGHSMVHRHRPPRHPRDHRRDPRAARPRGTLAQLRAAQLPQGPGAGPALHLRGALRPHHPRRLRPPRHPARHHHRLHALAGLGARQVRRRAHLRGAPP